MTANPRMLYADCDTLEQTEYPQDTVAYKCDDCKALHPATPDMYDDRRPDFKKCGICGKTYPKDEFDYRLRKHMVPWRLYIQSYCKPCHRDKCRGYQPEKSVRQANWKRRYNSSERIRQRYRVKQNRAQKK